MQPTRLKSSQTRQKSLENALTEAGSPSWFWLLPVDVPALRGVRTYLASMNEPHTFAELPTRLERLLTIQQLSDYLGVPVKTLYEWRTLHFGPRAVKVGRALRYPESRVAAWLEEQP